MNYITYNYALDALVAAMDKKIDVHEATKTFTHVLEIKDKMAQTAVYGLIAKAVKEKPVYKISEDAALDCFVKISELLGIEPEEQSYEEMIENAVKGGLPLINPTSQEMIKLVVTVRRK